MTTYCYAFDVDETLVLSGGPISLAHLEELVELGNTVGLCGNWATAVRQWPDAARVISFIGPMHMNKAAFLEQIKVYWPHDRYVMVGNDPAKFGASNDIEAARLAGWEFLTEKQFARGLR